MDSKIGNAPLNSSVVRIFKDKGDVKGAGFLVSEKHIVTCAHVVARALDLPDTYEKMPEDKICLDFPLLSSQDVLTARISRWHPPQANGEGDVAELEIESSPPDGARPIRMLKVDNLWGHKYRVFGVPEKTLDGEIKFDGFWGEGELREVQAIGWLQMDPLSVYPVEQGFSGTPVWDEELKCVVGMVVAVDIVEKKEIIADLAEKKQKIKAAFMIPSAILQTCSSHLKVIDPLVEYKKRVSDKTRLVKLHGFPPTVGATGDIKNIEVPLDEVYIRIQSIEEKRKRREKEAELVQIAGQIQGKGMTNPFRKVQHVDPIDPEVALQKHKAMIILGSMGSGKSTLLQYLARRAANDPDGPVPIQISLRYYAAELERNDSSLSDFALESATEEFADPAEGGKEQLRHALENAKKNGEVLWLVDALDEARKYSEKAARQAKGLSDSGRIIITSRPQLDSGPTGLRELPDSQDMPHYEILPLTEKDVGQFLIHWFDVLAEQRQQDPDWAKQSETWLKEQLAQSPRIKKLSRNPFMLTFLALLACKDSRPALPKQRAELFRRYIEELIEGWEAHPELVKDGSSTFKHITEVQNENAREADREGLYYIGWYLHISQTEGNREERVREKVVGALKKYFKVKWPTKEYSAQAVLEFWRQAGILELRHQTVSFSLEAFQEYGTAILLAQFWENSPKQAWDFVLPRLHHYAWREPILLLSGVWEKQSEEKRLNELIEHLLKGPSPFERVLHRDLQLAAGVLGEVISPPPGQQK